MREAHLTRISLNQKTGPIPVSTYTRENCPDVCPFRQASCYAELGPLRDHWNRVTQGTRGTDWESHCALVSMLPKHQLWRAGQAGDFPGDKTTLDREKMELLIRANRNRRGFGFTHYDVVDNLTNRAIVAQANQGGFTLNLSANHLAHADQLAQLNIAPVVTVLPSTHKGKTATPEGRPVIVCPAYANKDVTCATCQLCAKADRKTIVGFPAHGTRKKLASLIASVYP